MTAVIAETTRAETWLYTRLTANASITAIVGSRIYADVMPQSVTTYPALVIQYDGSAGPTYGNGPAIVWTRMGYIVKAVTTGHSNKSLQTLMDLVLNELHATAGGTGDAAIDYCIYKAPFRMTTIETNVLYQFLGGRFELAVRSTG